MEEICQSVFTKLIACMDSEMFMNDRKEWYAVFFRSIRENKEFFQIFLDAHLQISDQSMLDALNPASSVREHYVHAAREGAFFNILTDWFRSGMRETPEEMAQICYDTLMLIEEA